LKALVSNGKHQIAKTLKGISNGAFFVGLVALVVGFFLGAKLIAKGSLPGIKEMQKHQAIDRANYLFTLRRELANILIWRDPQRYVKLYQELCSEFNIL
jgi:hypothetical protein